MSFSITKNGYYQTSYKIDDSPNNMQPFCRIGFLLFAKYLTTCQLVVLNMEILMILCKRVMILGKRRGRSRE